MICTFVIRQYKAASAEPCVGINLQLIVFTFRKLMIQLVPFTLSYEYNVSDFSPQETVLPPECNLPRLLERSAPHYCVELL